MSSAPAPTSHYRLGPSSSSRWLVCPGSALAPEDMPQVENVYGGRDEGTEAHAWAANILIGAANPCYVPLPYKQGVTMYVDHVLSNGCKNPPMVERQWQSLSIDEFGGTIDCLLIEDGKAAFYDFKYGKWPVKAEGNTQLLCYASIIAEHFTVEEFWGVIVQPNSRSKEKISVASFSPMQVETHREQVAAAADSHELVAGQHCLFCPLLQAGHCNVGRRHAMNRGWIGKYKHLPS